MSTGGTALPTMISLGDSGVTSSWSKVPCSRSRATDSAVSISVWIMLNAAIRPGRKFQRVLRFGLNQARCTTVTGGGGRGGPFHPEVERVAGVVFGVLFEALVEGVARGGIERGIRAQEIR